LERKIYPLSKKVYILIEKVGFYALQTKKSRFSCKSNKKKGKNLLLLRMVLSSHATLKLGEERLRTKVFVV